MHLKEINSNKFSDDSYEVIIKTKPTELVYLGYFLEGFEGFCYFTTLNKKEMKVKITVTEDYVTIVNKILKFLKNYQL